MRALLVAAMLAALGPELPAFALCLSGTSVGCDDGDPCTADRCDGLACLHTPVTGPACNDDDPCTRDDRCDAGRCVGIPLHCDDGFACTDDACVGGRCTFVPIDSRCVPPDACTSAVCAPAKPAHDELGCAPGVARAEGEECAEDGDAARRTPACAAGACMPPSPMTGTPADRHARLASMIAVTCGTPTPATTRVVQIEPGPTPTFTASTPRTTCASVEEPFALALALAVAARALATEVGDGPAALAAHLAAVGDAADVAARTLAGKTPAAEDGVLESLLQRRARIALRALRRGRSEMVAALRAASVRRVRAEVSGGVAGAQLRALARSLRQLRAELRRLARGHGSFVRPELTAPRPSESGRGGR